MEGNSKRYQEGQKTTDRIEQVLYRQPGKEDGRGGVKFSTLGEERRRPLGNNLFTVSSKAETWGHHIQLGRSKTGDLFT